MDWYVFISIFWVVSLLPGLNMTLALSLGMSIGYKKTLNMMYGCTLSLAIVAYICTVSLGVILSKFPVYFQIFTIICALYLLYLSYKMFTETHIDLNTQTHNISSKALFWQGFMSSISNPKAWAFFISILPPFLDKADPFGFRLYEMIFAIMMIEMIDLHIYALGGLILKKILSKKANILQKISAICIALVAIMMIIERF